MAWLGVALTDHTTSAVNGTHSECALVRVNSLSNSRFINCFANCSTIALQLLLRRFWFYLAPGQVVFRAYRGSLPCRKLHSVLSYASKRKSCRIFTVHSSLFSLSLSPMHTCLFSFSFFTPFILAAFVSHFSIAFFLFAPNSSTRH